ncbi:hypothetical protein [Mesorhizobium sp. 1B3]|uniref:hypothetical protein n=1 Tax=Mesorhizobium sp. 1B3 TaxID=3243599 RepID=UPI003D99B286
MPAQLLPFLRLRRPRERRIHRPGLGSEQADRGKVSRLMNGQKEIMEDSVNKSCWGLTAKAVIGFAGIILLAWLVGGSESAAVLATAG